MRWRVHLSSARSAADRSTALLSTDTQAIKLVLNSNYGDEQQIAIREIRSYIWSQEFLAIQIMLALALLVIKLKNWINIPWLFVLAPFWGPALVETMVVYVPILG